MDEYYKVAVEIVKRAGQVIRDTIENREKIVSTKSCATDLVTETDKAVEVLIVGGLREKFPSHKFLGEEDVSASKEEHITLTDDPTWIIDPIDGTMNFVHSNNLVAISVGLSIKKKLVMGIIYTPIIDSLYTAIKGKGAFKNGKPIRVSKCTKKEEALVLYELWAMTGEKNKEFQLHDVSLLWSNFQAIRSNGSACVSLVMIADGQADAYIQSGLRIWDMAAGAVIIQEAGGVVMSIEGKTFDSMSRNILVASSPELAQQILDLKLKTPVFPSEHPTVTCTL